MEKKIDALTAAVSSLSKDLGHIKSSQDLMSKKYDDLLSEYKKVNADQKELVKKNRKLEEIVLDMRKRLEIMENDKLVQDVEIVGMQERDKEDVGAAVIKLAASIGVDLQAKDIKKCYRIGNVIDKEKPRVVVVMGVGEDLKSKLIKASRGNIRKQRGSSGASKSVIYINERLTKYTRQLFMRTK